MTSIKVKFKRWYYRNILFSKYIAKFRYRNMKKYQIKFPVQNNQYNMFKIKGTHVQTLLSIHSEIEITPEGKCYYHLYKKWSDLEKQFAERYIKTITGYRQIKTMLENNTFPEDEIEEIVTDVTTNMFIRF
jgi:hypothetical protein